MSLYPAAKFSPASGDSSDAPSVAYQRGVAEKRWDDDPAQREILTHFDRIQHELLARSQAGWLQQLGTRWSRAAPVRGLYLWGSVGRGKTFLMDLFYDSVPDERKLRLHFHRFMARVQDELRQLEGRQDPLKDVAAHFAAQARLLCLDEFFVSDIADAMILGGLLRHLFAAGVTVVTTSNILPAQLYKEGLQRERFLPAITLIEQKCEVVHTLSPNDYRLRVLNQARVYYTPLSADAERALALCFTRLASGVRQADHEITLHDRSIPLRQLADGVIWFAFDALCDGPRSVADYIEIARSFHSVLISGVPQFTPMTENQARRFVDLVDEFYDRNVKLILSASVPVIDLYEGHRLRAEFARTESRLIEMQSQDYLAREHRG
jgi:cell division protein ZapE